MGTTALRGYRAQAWSHAFKPEGLEDKMLYHRWKPGQTIKFACVSHSRHTTYMERVAGQYQPLWQMYENVSYSPGPTPCSVRGMSEDDGCFIPRKFWLGATTIEQSALHRMLIRRRTFSYMYVDVVLGHHGSSSDSLCEIGERGNWKASQQMKEFLSCLLTSKQRS